jgi:3-dehydroquinate synthase
MTKINVGVQPRPYEVWIEGGLLGRVGERLQGLLGPGRRCFVVTVAPVRKPWGRKLTSSLAAAGLQVDVLTMPDGERHKTLATAEKLASQMVKRGAGRDSVVVAFGGGVVGDVAGLLASLYMRGVDLVQIPTTLLAQVDAAVGGKTGVNLRAGKNLMGTYHQPRAVLMDPSVLKTLPAREFRAGLYESLKCGVIGNPELFQRMEEQRERILKRDPAALEWIITASVKLKAAVVEKDERESGLRQVLNFGHTIGHALEAETGYQRFLHGEAVAWGMVAAAKIAAVAGKLDAAEAGRIASVILSYGRLPKVQVSPRKIMKRLQADKKTRAGRVHFVLPVAVGRVEVVSDVPEAVVLAAVEELRLLQL